MATHVGGLCHYHYPHKCFHDGNRNTTNAPCHFLTSPFSPSLTRAPPPHPLTPFPAVVPTGSGSQIVLATPLMHSHDGNRNAVADGFGGTVDIRAEVALLDRNIVVEGVDEPAPNQYDGE